MDAKLSDEALRDALALALTDLEASGEVVICRPAHNVVLQRLHDAALTVLPQSDLTPAELSGVRSLILNAIRDKRFFDWEQPTLTGFTAEAFEVIARKLPNV